MPTHAGTSPRSPSLASTTPQPRRLLGDAGFDRIVDAGLGAGPVEYLDMVLHTFPAAEDPADAFPDAPAARPSPRATPTRTRSPDALDAGDGETAARCGMLDIAGVTVGAAFVGAFASTLVVADILRLLHEGESYSVVTVDLRHPAGIQAITNAFPRQSSNTAFTLAE